MDRYERTVELLKINKLYPKYIHIAMTMFVMDATNEEIIKGLQPYISENRDKKINQILK